MRKTGSRTSTRKTAQPMSGCFKAVLIGFVILVLGGLAAVFVAGDVAKSFWDKVPTGFLTGVTKVNASNVLIDIGRSHGDVLEVASPLKTMELFSKADSRFAAWGKVYLGTSVTEIKVPASYRFHIKLSEMKGVRVDEQNKIFIVKVPVIHPSLPVAFDTTGVEKRSEDGWFRFDGAQQLAAMEKNITPDLEKRATQHLPAIREHARGDIEEFVQKWIVDTRPEYKDKISTVKVIFEGENEQKILERPPLVP